MKKYYVIPMIESGIFFPYRDGSDISICDYVKRYYPRLAHLENERLSIICSGNYCSPFTKKQKEQLQDNADQKRKVANELGIPLYILAINDGKKTYEVETHSIISSSNQAFLDIREQPRNIFLTYYNGDYIQKVRRLINRKNFTVIQSGTQKVIKR